MAAALVGAVAAVTTMAAPAQAFQFSLERGVRGAYATVTFEHGVDVNLQVKVWDREADGHRAVGVLYQGGVRQECHNTSGNGTVEDDCDYGAVDGMTVSFRVDVREGTKIIRSSDFIVATYRNGRFEDVYVP
ncbi:hypothetical protein K1W54_39795 [Micromonospora sp. CPCC 205371]|nr:hypothetical protein [Micromonospora sp. CPCC 205371]